MIDKKRKKTSIILALTVMFFACGTGCGEAKEGGKLSTPENVRVEQRVLYWDEVENADYYVVSASNGKRYETTECQVVLADFPESGDYEFMVFAKSYDDKYEISKSGKVKEYLAEPVAEGEDSYRFQYKWVEDLNGYSVSIGDAVLQADLILPDYFQGLPVKRIAAFGFTFTEFMKSDYGNIWYPRAHWYDETGCNTIIKSISLPQYVEEIGYGAFYGLTEIEEVVIPKEVKVIEHYAFGDCAKLKKVTFPNGLRTIMAWAFLDTALESLDLPNSVTSIGEEAFACLTYKDYTATSRNKHISSALSRVVFPKSIKEIERRVLLGRENLKEIVFQGVEYTYSETQPSEEGNYWRYDSVGNVFFWE